MSRIWRWVAYGVSAAILFTVGIAISHRFQISVDIMPVVRAADEDTRYHPPYALEPGEQLVMVYIGSSACGWSNDPALPGVVEKLKVRLADNARERGLSFKAVGVSIDWSTEAGIDHLKRFGRFDEVATGYNWAGTHALRYLWSGYTPRVATPTLLIYRRQLQGPDVDSGQAWYGELDLEILTAKVGLHEILEWAEGPLGDVALEEGALGRSHGEPSR